MSSEIKQGQDVEGVDERRDNEVRDPETLDQPNEGPTMTGGGAAPAGNSMDHWNTASPNTDATRPETMPNTPSTPMPGETEDREPV
jgi:hypothetical protein